MVEQRGIEPLTSALRTRRSAKLSYCPTREENTVSSFRFQVSSSNTQIKQKWIRTETPTLCGDLLTCRLRLQLGVSQDAKSELRQRRQCRVHRAAHTLLALTRSCLLARPLIAQRQVARRLCRENREMQSSLGERSK